MVALAVAAGCSGSSSTPSGDADAGANSQSGMTYGCQLEEADNCFCSNGNAPTTGTCNTQSVIGAVAAGGASCCKFNDVSNSCSCWAFICDNYASGLSTTDCSCGWFGPTHPQTSCTGTYCCAIPASGFGANAEPGVCHCGDTPCSPGQTQVAQCDSTTTPPNCPPGATEVMACD